MRRSARAITSVLVALLVLIEATPSISSSEMPSATTQCGAAAVGRVNVLALLSEPASSVDPVGFERAPLVPFTVLAASTRVTAPGLSAGAPRSAIDGGPRAWLLAHRRRARAPDDSDPY